MKTLVENAQIRGEDTYTAAVVIHWTVETIRDDDGFTVKPVIIAIDILGNELLTDIAIDGFVHCNGRYEIRDIIIFTDTNSVLINTF